MLKSFRNIAFENALQRLLNSIMIFKLDFIGDLDFAIDKVVDHTIHILKYQIKLRSKTKYIYWKITSRCYVQFTYKRLVCRVYKISLAQACANSKSNCVISWACNSHNLKLLYFLFFSVWKKKTKKSELFQYLFIRESRSFSKKINRQLFSAKSPQAFVGIFIRKLQTPKTIIYHKEIFGSKRINGGWASLSGTNKFLSTSLQQIDRSGRVTWPRGCERDKGVMRGEEEVNGQIRARQKVGCPW